MLKKRIITATVLLVFLLPLLFLNALLPFALLTLVAIGFATWEWGNLNGQSFGKSVIMACGIIFLCAISYLQGWINIIPKFIWLITSLIWIIGATLICRLGYENWKSMSSLIRCLLGVTLLYFAWLAMIGAKEIGINFLISIFCLVWATDIFAYIGGKNFGKRKLAPKISPGKSWEGVLCGLLSAILLAFIWIIFDKNFQFDSTSLFTLILQRFGYFGLILSLIFLVAASILGDLTESLVKRAAKVKDSSQLLPGHGGVLDRIDALLPVFPISMTLISF